MNAEANYLFRHALLRDAAYQLQLPGDRARLHALALALIEDFCGGRAPEPPPLDAPDASPLAPHATDPFALELAGHARAALRGNAPAVPASVLPLYLRRAAVAADRRFRPEAESCWSELADLLEGAARAMACGRAGSSARGGGRLRVAEPHFERSLALSRKTGDRRSEGSALGSLAGVYRETGRIELAERTHEQALAILREVGDRRSEGNALGNLALVYRETGRVELAQRTHEQALAILREVGDRRSEGIELGNLANVYKETGRVELAERTHEQALAIHREVGNRRDEAIALANLAGLYGESGRVERGEATFQQALEILRAAGNRRLEGAVICSCAALLATTGRDAEARARWAEGAALLKHVGDVGELRRQTEDMRAACAKAGIPAFGDPSPPTP